MAYIKPESIDKVKESSDIVKVITSFCPDIQKRGKNYFCLSPFGTEKNASCAVDPVRQIFKDFSSGKGGDVITFLMEKKGVTYIESIEWLASFQNMELEYENPEAAKKKIERLKKLEELRPILKASHEQYRKAFRELPDDHPAKVEIYEHRKYTEDQVIEWQIGYAPGHRFLYQMIMEKGITREARHLGLIGDKADKYWNRVTFPIHDKNGLIIGLAGRDLSGQKKSAKWINPVENELYHKNRVWYGLHKATDAIRKVGEAWVVEGYNDVIGWHSHGIYNTIAPCGTAITDIQMRILRRHTAKVVMCMDPDPAGIRSLIKHIPMFFQEGFNVDVVLLPCDPDDFVRNYADTIGKYGPLEKMMCETWTEGKSKQRQSVRINGFKFLLDHYLTDDPLDAAKNISKLLSILLSINDKGHKEFYRLMLIEQSGFKAPTINGWIKDLEKEKEEAAAKAKGPKKADHELEPYEYYLIPEEVTESLDTLKPDIERYGIFQSNNRIWCKQGVEPPFSFKPISNFSIEIIQHMQDEKFPMKLLRIKNVRGKERIFDTLSDNLNSPQQFQNIMAGHGNFLWKGGRQDHLKLLEQMFDRMGDGDKIDVLGWQPVGFWVFNNKVVRPGHGHIDIDDNGVFKVDNTHYYVPSANKVYRNNAYKYVAQKKVQVKPKPDFTFTAYCEKMMTVHGTHAITGILFTMASIFQDIVVNRLGNFPIPFLYGPPSTGKDQLIHCCQSFFGDPQEAINLESGISTVKAQVREFAQFQNMIGHLSEYKRGDRSIDGLIKGLWDRRGYKRGTLDSHVGSESIPILSSTFLTGNDYPDQDAVISRLLWEEMTKKEFTAEEKKRYDELNDMSKAGISYFTLQILEHRGLWEQNFKDVFRKVSKNLTNDMSLLALPSRIISNLSVLGAAYELLKDHVQFPFAWPDMMKHWRECIDRQLRKLNTASLHARWWDIFLAQVRSETAPLVNDVDFRIKDDRLYFNMTNTWSRITTQWYRQYQENTPSKAKISDTLKDNHELDMQQHDSFRFDGSTTGPRTSAYSVLVAGTHIKHELQEAIEWQDNMKRSKGWGTTPVSSESSKGNTNGTDTLPF